LSLLLSLAPARQQHHWTLHEAVIIRRWCCQEAERLPRSSCRPPHQLSHIAQEARSWPCKPCLTGQHRRRRDMAQARRKRAAGGRDPVQVRALSMPMPAPAPATCRWASESRNSRISPHMPPWRPGAPSTTASACSRSCRARRARPQAQSGRAVRAPTPAPRRATGRRRPALGALCCRVGRLRAWRGPEAQASPQAPAGLPGP